MNKEQFYFWCAGFAELNGETAPTQAQWRIIKDHIEMVDRPNGAGMVRGIRQVGEDTAKAVAPLTESINSPAPLKGCSFIIKDFSDEERKNAARDNSLVLEKSTASLKLAGDFTFQPNRSC